MTKRVNTTSKKVEQVENKKSETVVTVTNVIEDRIKAIDYSKSNKLVKSIKNISFEFSAVRSAILAYVANEQSLKFASDDARIKLLRTSKKDSVLYATLCNLSEFSYKAISNKDQNKSVVINYRKAYSIKSVLNVCDLYLQTSSVELTQNLISAIRFEREKKAVERLQSSIEKMQNSASLLASTIENLQDAALISEYTEQLTTVEKLLKVKIAMFEYVSLASNRANIK